ncbi:uncharacterized protein LOC111295087 isoform X1 [Durio zibethinus]|uniref:Uncharacterized protein LOC111295087 isoform X1 n=1 Tax=Durio zibethinus TaxID=66656 RepID=A0A6P5YVM6_DURZI|nr:uncharacterized protein LOC111295087 isoform X1 [Durio zibethinus]
MSDMILCKLTNLFPDEVAPRWMELEILFLSPPKSGTKRNWAPSTTVSTVKDPLDAVDAAIVRVVEAELTKEREKTRLMEESLRADRAALEAKERERTMLVREKDRMVATKEAGDKLVAVFLEADGNNENFDEKAMMAAIVALLSHDGGDDGDGE